MITQEIIEEYKKYLTPPHPRLYQLGNNHFPNYTYIKRSSDITQQNEGHFENIPSGPIDFLMIMEKFPERKRFIDVGCGTGEKTFLAYLLGFEKSIGLEYSKEYHNYSKSNIQIEGIEFINDNAFDYDFSNEQVVYMYHPMRFKEPMIKLYKKIIDELPQGSVMIEKSPNAAGLGLSETIKEWGFKYVFEPHGGPMYRRF